MADIQTWGKKYLKIKDSSGAEWLCPVEALKKADTAAPEELADCVEVEVVTRYAGNIEAER